MLLGPGDYIKTGMQKNASNRKSVMSWALYDAGNSAFATVVMAGFFPVFFKSFWSAGADVTVSTARLGFANAAAGILVALLAPLLGAVADCGSAKKKFLGAFALLGIMSTAGLFFIGKGAWPGAVALFVIGMTGFSAANIFYDALLPSVAGENDLDRVSALGFALGYLGGGLLFALCVWMTASPAFFGLSSKASAVSISFLLTSAWWTAFTLPLLFLVSEPASTNATKASRPVRDGLARIVQTFHEVRRSKAVWLFLLAYWFYIDGVDTIIRMAVDYGMSLGFSSNDLIAALLITQFIAFPCALLFGKLGRLWGPKNALYLAIVCYLGIVAWGMLMQSKEEFYMLAALVGMVQGGIQALSRSYFARLIPAGQEGQFFGFYNMVGKYAAIFGPALMGISGYLTGSPRAGIASVSVLFIIGGFLLWLVREDS